MSSLKIGEMGIIFQQMVLGQLYIHKQNKKFGILPHIVYKKYMQQGLKYRHKYVQSWIRQYF